MSFIHVRIGASLIGIVAASPAWAQDASADQTGLREIVVTAQKRSENLQKVPISVTAADAATLANKGVANTADIGTIAAGVNVRINNSSFLPYIRGIGTNATTTESPASLYVDGVYIPYSRGGLSGLSDVTQIAVLKGPQGTLFGRNSTAGVIQVTTRNPTQDFHAELGSSIDNYETLRTDAYIAGGLAEGVTASLAGQYGVQGIGWGKDYTTGHDTHRVARDVNLRGKLVFTPSTQTKISVVGQYFDQKFVGIVYTPYPGTRTTYPGALPVANGYNTRNDLDGFLRNKGYSASVTINQHLGFADLLSISSYQNMHSTLLFDNDGTAAPLFTVSGDQPNHAYTQELQLTSPTSGPLTWVVGAYYFNNKEFSSPSLLTMRAPFSSPLPFSFIRRDGHQTTQSVAGFAQGTWEFLTGSHLTLGARYTWEKRDLLASQQFSLTLPTGPGPLLASSQSIEKPSFRAALDHQFAPYVLGYVSFNTGFKSGGYNLLAPIAPAYLPEKLNAYEAGLKTQLFDRRIRLNASVFYYDYTNIQVSQVVNNIAIVSNAAKAHTYGLDLEMQALMTKGLELSGALGLLHAEYADYPNAQIAIPNPSGGVTITAGNVAGNRLPSSEKVSGNLALDYDTALAGARLHANVTGAYHGDSYLEPDNFIRQPAYVTLNSSLKVTLPDERTSVTIFGRNLLDERVLTAANTSANVASVVYDAPPRTYGVALHYSF